MTTTPAMFAGRRILLVSDGYPPMPGGANRATQTLAHELTRRGAEVAVATTAQRGLPAFELDGKIAVFRARDLGSRLPRHATTRRFVHNVAPLPDPEAVVRLWRIIRTFKPELVHSYGWLTYSCRAALWRNSTPLLLSARDYGHICPKRTLFRNERPCDGPSWGKCAGCALKAYGVPKAAIAVVGVLGSRRWLADRVDALHSNSHYVERQTMAHLFNGRSDLHRVVFPSFALNAERASQRPDGLPNQPFILFVGSLRRIKGVPELLAAYSRLRRGAPPLVLLGPRARDTPTELPENVYLIDGAPHDAVLATWPQSLFGVSCSVWPEPFGQVVHEGMRAGRAIVGTTPGGHEDMIRPGLNGFLVPAGDVLGLTNAMQQLVDDPELRRRLGNQARQDARAFEETAVMPTVERLYAELLAR